MFIILGGAAYFFWDRALPVIRNKISEKKRFFQGLKNQERDQSRKSIEIKRSTLQQEKYCVELQQKVTKWNGVFQTRKRERDEIRKARHERISQLVKIQNYSYMRLQLDRAIIPEVVDHARSSVVEQYQDMSKNKKYVDRILEKMDIACKVAQMEEARR